MNRAAFAAVAVACIGLAASFGYAGGIAAMALMPALTMSQRCRQDSWLVAFSYYSAASWPIIPSSRNFFGPEASMPEALGLWTAAAALLSSAWPALWSADRRQIIWRVPFVLAIAAVPPLGIIGWASPLSSAGVLFPGTGWAGLAVTALLPACLIRIPRTSFATAAFASLVLNTGVSEPSAPAHWEAVDTQFGAIAHGSHSATAEFGVLRSIMDRALNSRALVIVFPETVVPMWTEATDLFWQPTIDELRVNGKTVLLGAGLPVGQGQAETSTYLNTVLLRGAELGVMYQRIPVPLGMWRPIGPGVPLNLVGSGIIDVGGERAAVVVCYEQLLIWPLVRSLVAGPSLLIGVANDHWVAETPIPRYQRAMLDAWSRLFHIPFVSATNL